MDLIYWSVRSFSSRGGIVEKEVDGGTIIKARCEHKFIRVLENLVQHPSNNISTREDYSGCKKPNKCHIF